VHILVVVDTFIFLTSSVVYFYLVCLPLANYRFVFPFRRDTEEGICFLVYIVAVLGHSSYLRRGLTCQRLRELPENSVVAVDVFRRRLRHSNGARATQEAKVE
jgi:hypothetical protein